MLVYESAEQVDTEQLAADVPRATDDVDSADQVATMADGRVAVASASIPTAEMSGMDFSMRKLTVRSGAPSAEFEFTFKGDESGGTLTIVHSSGETIPASELYVRGSGITETGSWADLDGETSTTVDGDPAVASGDRVTVSTSTDEYVARAVWESSDGSSHKRLGDDEPGL